MDSGNDRKHPLGAATSSGDEAGLNVPELIAASPSPAAHPEAGSGQIAQPADLRAPGKEHAADSLSVAANQPATDGPGGPGAAGPAIIGDPGFHGLGDHFFLNYYNYLTEVEEEFVRRRGSYLLISPMDWALVESWKDAGIPLHIVMRGISRAFDGYDARGAKFRKVNTVFYCQQSVEESFAEYRLSLVGAPPQAPDAEPGGGPPPAKRKKASAEAMGFSKEALVQFVSQCESELRQAAEKLPAILRQRCSQQGQVPEDSEPASLDFVTRALRRLEELRLAIEAASQLNPESVELDLDAIDRMLLDHLKAAWGAEGIDEMAKEARTQLRQYRKTMDQELYQQTVNNFIARRLRELSHIPRLSLFYMP